MSTTNYILTENTRKLTKQLSKNGLCYLETVNFSPLQLKYALDQQSPNFAACTQVSNSVFFNETYQTYQCKESAYMHGTWIQSLGQEDALETQQVDTCL